MKNSSNDPSLKEVWWWIDNSNKANKGKEIVQTLKQSTGITQMEFSTVEEMVSRLQQRDSYANLLCVVDEKAFVERFDAFAHIPVPVFFLSNDISGHGIEELKKLLLEFHEQPTNVQSDLIAITPSKGIPLDLARIYWKARLMPFPSVAALNQEIESDVLPISRVVVLSPVNDEVKAIIQRHGFMGEIAFMAPA